MSKQDNEINITNLSVTSPKVKAAAAAGTIVTAVALVARLFGYEVNLDVDALAALLTILMAGAAYLKRDPLRH